MVFNGATISSPFAYASTVESMARMDWMQIDFAENTRTPDSERIEPNDGYYQQMIDNAVKRIEELEREVERWKNDAILAMKNAERDEARQEVERLRSSLINISEWYAMPSDELADYARLTLSSKHASTGGK